MGFNFSANWKFYVEYIDGKYVLKQKACKNTLPSYFFDEQRCITNITAIVGENGAGKTTLIRHLVGAYRGDSGYVELEGMRIYENSHAKSRLVYIPDEFFDTFGSNVNDVKQLYQYLNNGKYR